MYFLHLVIKLHLPKIREIIMNKGLFGKILWIDLSNDNIKEEKLPSEVYREYLGGYGLGCKLIFENTSREYDPLGPDAIFGFFPGLFTGTTAPFSGRYMVAGKSPLTKTWGDANSGGTFGPEIKRCGYDAILFKGISEKPKYLLINGDDIALFDASDIWGLDIIEAENKLRNKHGKFIKTAGIGQAGENLSLISGIANDKGRIAARSGLGAVMGSKNLKMLAIKGNMKVDYYDRENFIAHVKSYNSENKIDKPGFFLKRLINVAPRLAKTIRRFHMNTSMSPTVMRQLWRRYGTATGNTVCAETGDSPIKNWSGIGIINYPYSISKAISAVEIEKYKTRDYGCFSCPVQCGAILKVPELNLEETHQPEYETCAAFGGMVLNDDLISIFEINELCNRAAIDTISVGGTVAFAIECFENGIITEEETGGLKLDWGNSKNIVELVKLIIEREGIGNILADGTKKAAEILGKGSERFAIHSLGQEIGMHNPRIFPSLGFSYAFDPTPGKHTNASVDMAIGMRDPATFLKGLKVSKNWDENNKTKAKTQKLINGVTQVINCAGLCMMSNYFGQYPLIELIQSLTGWNYSIKEIVETGLRIQTIRQAFTLREGIEIANNRVNGRIIGNPPDNRGPTKGKTIDYVELYSKVCEEYGWNPKNGYPLIETLEKLNLNFAIEHLYKSQLVIM